ncbi:RNA polymerase sigma factor [Micromonospora sp. LOL_024]|uniref:RNA polymerase sigma factor n=1 Tax=Micromonospora sp. LOL_024 TaxID=3345412 RepID=UPI003A883A85
MTHQLRPPDEALWSSIAAGEEMAFGSLFDRYSRAVYNHAFRLTGSWSAAEDIAQAPTGGARPAGGRTATGYLDRYSG